MVQDDLVDIYGPPDEWNFLLIENKSPEEGYLRKNKFINKPVEGQQIEYPLDNETFYKAMRAPGVVLVLHAQKHLDVKALTARVLEAAAASCVIISDTHPLLEEFFGDSIYYIDHKKSNDEIIAQIIRYRTDIMNNKDDAEKKARKAHNIFVNLFSLERQLEAFRDFHLSSPPIPYTIPDIIALFEKAQNGDPQAQNDLGKRFIVGDGVPQNKARAFMWYEKAAIVGHAEAQNNLGSCYLDGAGVLLNHNKAFQCFTLGAMHGDQYARHNLGLCFQFGRGTQKSSVDAIYWFTKAAEQGNLDAQFDLGAIYYEEYKNTKSLESLEKVQDWLSKAAPKYVKAKELLDILKQIKNN